MNRKKLFALFLILFIVLETISVIIGLSSLRSQPASPDYLEERSLRIGLLPPGSKKLAAKKWTPFLEKIREDFHLSIKPYFANSTQELVRGFQHGVLDVVFINSALYLMLKKDNEDLKAVAYHKSDVFSGKGGCAALVTTNDRARFVSQTKGLRLTYTNPYSLTGHIVPKEYLMRNLSMPLDEWFDSVSYSGTDLQAVTDLFKDDTDVIAVDYNSLKEIAVKHDLDISRLHVLWMLRNLPSKVLCRSNRLSEQRRHEMERALVIEDKNMETYKNRSIILQQIDHTYRKHLKNFQNFMKDGSVTDHLPDNGLP